MVFWENKARGCRRPFEAKRCWLVPCERKHKLSWWLHLMCCQVRCLVDSGRFCGYNSFLNFNIIGALQAIIIWCRTVVCCQNGQELWFKGSRIPTFSYFVLRKNFPLKLQKNIKVKCYIPFAMFYKPPISTAIHILFALLRVLSM